ncbi:DsrE family protein [Actinokineospora xionganensis]|uniref:DsrE family protein n=1 Tax=Actinokineospora xionganensis TaxID=2684470 RepID=A0ABR7L557_9PSEU|nr:DsrE family protein [Actinokineospora xionganensis]MBC6447472.1 DsrE family protein [Actinokineospora xionganensis]
MSASGVTDTAPGHLLVASRGPWSGPGAARFLADAAALAETGVPVTVVLLGDGTPLAVAGGTVELVTLLDAGGEVWVDRFGAAQRGIAEIALPEGARWVDMDDVAARLLDPDVRAVWH